MSHPAEKVKIEEGWKKALWNEFDKPYFHQLKAFLLQEKQSGMTIFPPGAEIFNAFNQTPFDQVKAVIIGQDPYHGPGQAHGLCFSVKEGVRVPPSLKNIYKELAEDIPDFSIPAHGNLLSWAQQGVLMLNAMLTVRAHQAGSHKGRGWETFTSTAIQKLNEQKEGLVFLLWGKYAQEKGAVIDPGRHHVLKAAHPSPFAAHNGFFGCKHFSQTNQILQSQGKDPINWQI
ncbi:MAG: uracil-DNA glycosylase [Bacteroidota bacterium]